MLTNENFLKREQPHELYLELFQNFQPRISVLIDFAASIFGGMVCISETVHRFSENF